MGRGKVHPSVSGMMTGRWTRAAETFACRPGSPVLTDAAPPQVRVPLPAPSGYGWPERLPPERPRLYPAAFPCSCTHLLPPGTAQERTLLHMTPCPGSPAHPFGCGQSYTADGSPDDCTPGSPPPALCPFSLLCRGYCPVPAWAISMEWATFSSDDPA